MEDANGIEQHPNFTPPAKFFTSKDFPPTVKIVSTETGLGYEIINQSDFNSATMTLYQGA